MKRNKQQVPYTKQAFEKAFTEIHDQLSESVRAAIRLFIDAEDGWTTASEALSRLDWEEVRPFFEDAGKAEAQTIGARTKKHFRLLDQESIDDAVWTSLDSLEARGARPVKNDDDEQFYFDHRADIQQDASLTVTWERFIFGTEVECTDLHLGILECVRRLLPARQDIPSRVMVEVTAVESEKIRFKLKNEAACRYFQARYADFPIALAGLVEFRKTLAFQYDAVYEELKDHKAFGRSPRPRLHFSCHFT